MARIFRDCFDMIREMDRELKVSGITVPIKHYQNQVLVGENQNTKELIGVNFIITRPDRKKKEMLGFIFGDESEQILNYCEQEYKDRINPEGLNPGKSYLIRKDLWQKLMSKSDPTKFDYTYSERLNHKNQIKNVISTLKEDPHSRRAMLMVYFPEDSEKNEGFETRVPCSISYQFLIRNNKLFVLYYIRSNDYFKHFAIDIWLTHQLQEYIRSELLPVYPDLKIGPLNYYAGSLHAYNEDLSKWVIF